MNNNTDIQPTAYKALLNGVGLAISAGSAVATSASACMSDTPALGVSLAAGFTAAAAGFFVAHKQEMKKLKALKAQQADFGREDRHRHRTIHRQTQWDGLLDREM